MLWDTVVKTTSTPVIIRVNGVNLPSMADITVKLGTETYTKVSNPEVFLLDTNDITKLELLLGDTALAVGSYILHLSVTDADHPDGISLTDCILGDIVIKVRDAC
jgi:hypothetical protein